MKIRKPFGDRKGIRITDGYGTTILEISWKDDFIIRIG